jgi:hypothetical protein
MCLGRLLPSMLFFLACVLPTVWISGMDEANQRFRMYESMSHQESAIKTIIRDSLVSTQASVTKVYKSIVVNEQQPNRSQHNSTTNGDCCDVQIGYGFETDNWNNMYIQLLVLILIVSRWLITRVELNQIQRGLILVVTLATGADALNFASYLRLEIVYLSKYLLHAQLLIFSLSLLQFVFLHVDATEPDQHIEAYPISFKISQSSQPNRCLGRQEKEHLCWCMASQDPIVYVLLCSLFLHDGSYLVFRVIIGFSLGWQDAVNSDSNFVFFLMKNIFIILAQAYKVYCVLNHKKQLQVPHESHYRADIDPYRFVKIYDVDVSSSSSSLRRMNSSRDKAAMDYYFGGQHITNRIFKPALPPALFEKHGPSMKNQFERSQPFQDSDQCSYNEPILQKDYAAYKSNHYNNITSSFNPTIIPFNYHGQYASKIGNRFYGLPLNYKNKSLNECDVTRTTEKRPSKRSLNNASTNPSVKVLKSSKI